MISSSTMPAHLRPVVMMVTRMQLRQAIHPAPKTAAAIYTRPRSSVTSLYNLSDVESGLSSAGGFSSSDNERASNNLLFGSDSGFSSDSGFTTDGFSTEPSSGFSTEDQLFGTESDSGFSESGFSELEDSDLSIEPTELSVTPMRTIRRLRSPTPAHVPAHTPAHTPAHVPVVRGRMPMLIRPSIQHQPPIPSVRRSGIRTPVRPGLMRASMSSLAPVRTPSQVPVRTPSRVPVRQTQAPVRTPSRVPVRTPSRVPVRTPSRVPMRTPVRSTVRRV
jgi:hypothetical protein